MKKFSVLFITLILALALSACGNNTMDNNSMGSGTNSPNQNGSSLVSDLTPSNQNQQQNNQTTAITRERALEIALTEAGVKQADIRDLDIELDTERGVKIWEIDFDYGNTEYSYDVNADTGAITKVERERDN